jgi:uncharacterized protein
MRKTYYKLKERIKNHFHEILRTKKTPNAIAIGFSIGTFIAILPTPGFNILLGLLIIFFSKKVSKYALFIAIAFWNPLITAPLYYLSYKLGNLIFQINDPISLTTLLTSFKSISLRFMVGNLIIAFLVSIISYITLYYICNKIKEKKFKIQIPTKKTKNE